MILGRRQRTEKSTLVLYTFSKQALCHSALCTGLDCRFLKIKTDTDRQTGAKLTAQHTSHTIQNQNVSNESCTLNALKISRRAAMFGMIKRFRNST